MHALKLVATNGFCRARWFSFAGGGRMGLGSVGDACASASQ